MKSPFSDGFPGGFPFWSCVHQLNAIVAGAPPSYSVAEIDDLYAKHELLEAVTASRTPMAIEISREGDVLWLTMIDMDKPRFFFWTIHELSEIFGITNLVLHFFN